MSAFVIPIRVYYEDTDAGGVVYYANYFKFMERARTEWLRSLGFEQDQLAREGIIFAVRSANLEFLKPARFNDSLQVTAVVTDHGGASATFRQRVQRDGVTLCEGDIRIVCLDAKNFTPCAWPEKLAARLKGANA